MRIRHAIMISLLGQQYDRFHKYTEAKTLSERLDMVRQTPGVDGLEVGFPGEFRDLAAGLAQIKAAGWPISAVNQNTKSDAHWRRGSFTATDPAIRARAVQEMKTCMDLAAELGCYMVHCCPLIDGHNYVFQEDYVKQWDWLVQGLRDAASYRRDVRISLEFKPYEARNFCIVADTGTTLYLGTLTGENVGLTWDFGHALIARESPARSLALAGQAQRLFYIHFNDNMRDWDWDMLPGAVNAWDLLESLYYLERLDWEGWFSYDVLTRSGDDTLQNQIASIKIIQTAQRVLAKLGRERLDQIVAAGHPYEGITHLWETFLA